MKFFYEDILNGLTDIPVQGSPGSMVVNGENAQAVYAFENTTKVILAASLLGNGRIFACSHRNYYKWFVGKFDGLEGAFINNVKSWLINGKPVNDFDIIDASNINDKTDLNNFKIISWLGEKNVGNQVNQKIKEFVLNGGGLFCAMTFWSYLQNKNIVLDNIEMFYFLKDNAGIILIDDYFGCDPVLAVNKNMAQYSNYRTAVDTVCQNPDQVSFFCDTINGGIINMARVNIHDHDAVIKMKKTLLSQCKSKEWDPVPSSKNIIKTNEIKQITKLLGTFYVDLGEKAPNIYEFPFDFDNVPVLISNITLKLKSNFSERLSTGYYLPAGVEISIQVINGQPKDWKCRIGAHTDILHSASEYQRWPELTVAYTLKTQLNFISPFGGLVYFQWYV